MGARDGAPDELPQHQVELDGFWVGTTEVTVVQWRRVTGSVPGTNNDRCDDHPVVEVTWEDCDAFCRCVGSGVADGGAVGVCGAGPWGSCVPVG